MFNETLAFRAIILTSALLLMAVGFPYIAEEEDIADSPNPADTPCPSCTIPPPPQSLMSSQPSEGSLEAEEEGVVPTLRGDKGSDRRGIHPTDWQDTEMAAIPDLTWVDDDTWLEEHSAFYEPFLSYPLVFNTPDGTSVIFKTPDGAIYVWLITPRPWAD